MRRVVRLLSLLAFLLVLGRAGDLGVVSTNNFLFWADANAGRLDRMGYAVYLAGADLKFVRLRVETNSFPMTLVTNVAGRKFLFITSMATNGQESVPSEVVVFHFGIIEPPTQIQVK